MGWEIRSNVVEICSGANNNEKNWIPQNIVLALAVNDIVVVVVIVAKWIKYIWFVFVRYAENTYLLPHYIRFYCYYIICTSVTAKACCCLPTSQPACLPACLQTKKEVIAMPYMRNVLAHFPLMSFRTHIAYIHFVNVLRQIWQRRRYPPLYLKLQNIIASANGTYTYTHPQHTRTCGFLHFVCALFWQSS